MATQIRRAILRNDMRPGDSLPAEAQLIADFGVSRPTVREALRILESEDLIEVSRGARNGARVLQPSSDTVARSMGVALQTRGASYGDVYRARAAIEPIAARFAAETNAAPAALRLQAQLESQREAIAAHDEQRIWPAVSQFHRLLMEESGNVTLSLLGFALHDLVGRQLALLYEASPDHRQDWWARISVGLRSRERLVTLIRAGDGEAAAAHWALHMAETSRFWLSRIADRTLLDILP